MTRRIRSFLAGIELGFVKKEYFRYLRRRTHNFRSHWLGKPLWQPLHELWVIQETIHDTQTDVIIESGTYKGGSAYFYATLFDLIGRGRVITIDLKRRGEVDHPRITYLDGSSTDPQVLDLVRDLVRPNGSERVMVILDSAHKRDHVLQELRCYWHFVTPGNHMIVQDGVSDVHWIYRKKRPGPLRAIAQFLREDNPPFIVDEGYCNRFPFPHHPIGWLKRIAAPDG